MYNFRPNTKLYKKPNPSNSVINLANTNNKIWQRKVGNLIYCREIWAVVLGLGDDLANDCHVYRILEMISFQYTIQTWNYFCVFYSIKINRTIILPVVFYGCETWSLTLRNQRTLRVFENRVLRGVFGAKRDEVTGEWRTLHNEELNDLYCSPNIVRVMKSGRM